MSAGVTKSDALKNAVIDSLYDIASASKDKNPETKV
jgi:hypothetical protein